MPKSLNRVTLLGHCGKDAALTYTTNGVPCAKFSLATSSSYKKGDEWIESTEWHNLVLWQKLAEIAGEHVHKGDKIMVEGRIQTRSWDDKKSGEKRYMTEIVVSDLYLLGGRRESGEHEERGERSNRGQDRGFDQRRGGGAAPKQEEEFTGATDSDIPFLFADESFPQCPRAWRRRLA
jgi:single-strand DNA-binding protein